RESQIIEELAEEWVLISQHREHEPVQEYGENEEVVREVAGEMVQIRLALDIELSHRLARLPAEDPLPPTDLLAGHGDEAHCHQQVHRRACAEPGEPRN